MNVFFELCFSKNFAASWVKRLKRKMESFGSDFMDFKNKLSMISIVLKSIDRSFCLKCNIYRIDSVELQISHDTKKNLLTYEHALLYIRYVFSFIQIYKVRCTLQNRFRYQTYHNTKQRFQIFEHFQQTDFFGFFREKQDPNPTFLAKLYLPSLNFVGQMHQLDVLERFLRL